MNNEPNLLEDDFAEQAAQTQRRMAILGFVMFLILFVLSAVTLYFFLAAAGVVPPVDVVPVVPYV